MFSIHASSVTQTHMTDRVMKCQSPNHDTCIYIFCYTYVKAGADDLQEYKFIGGMQVIVPTETETGMFWLGPRKRIELN